MVFLAKYVYKGHLKPEYYKTIYADSLNEGIALANKFRRKGSICAWLTQKGDKL